MSNVSKSSKIPAKKSEGIVRAKSKFTSISNTAMRDKRLSFAARGVLARLLSNAPGFRMTAETLGDEGGCHRTTVLKMLDELRDVGYVTNVKCRGAGGHWSTIRIADDVPATTEAEIVARVVDAEIDEVALYWHCGPGHAIRAIVQDGEGWRLGPISVPKSKKAIPVVPKSGLPTVGGSNSISKTKKEILNPPPTSSQSPAREGRKDLQKPPAAKQPKQPVAQKLDQAAWLAERGVPEHVAGPWLAQLKLRPTAAGLKALETEAQEAGRSLAEVVAIMLDHGWAKWTAGNDQLEKPYPVPPSPIELLAAEQAKAQAERAERAREAEQCKTQVATGELLKKLTNEQLDAMAEHWCVEAGKTVLPFARLDPLDQKLCKGWLRGKTELLQAVAAS